MASVWSFLCWPRAWMTSQLRPLTLIQRHFIQSGGGSFRKAAMLLLSRWRVVISVWLKSTTVMDDGARSVGIEAWPPSGLDGSTPGSAPGVHPGRTSNSSKSWTTLKVGALVLRRRRMGDSGGRALGPAPPRRVWSVSERVMGSFAGSGGGDRLLVFRFSA